MPPMNSTQDTSLGEQPAGATLETPTGSEQQQSGNIMDDISKLSSAELMQILEGDVSPPTPSAEKPPSQAGENPPDGNANPDHNGSQKAPNRLSVRFLPLDEQQQMAEALAMVREKKASSVLEALSQLTGQQHQQPAANPDPDASSENNPPPGQTDETVSAIETRLSELREQRNTARLDYDAEAVDRLNEEIETEMLRLSDAKIQAALQQFQSKKSAESYQDTYQAAVDQMEAAYPEALDPDSAFYRALDDKVLAAQARKDPALADPNYILRFAEEVASLVGARKSPPSPPPTRQHVPFGSQVAPAGATSHRLTPDQARAIIRNAPIEALSAVVFTE